MSWSLYSDQCNVVVTTLSWSPYSATFNAVKYTSSLVTWLVSVIEQESSIEFSAKLDMKSLSSVVYDILL